MAIRDFYSDVDLKANQLFNSRVHNITTVARVALGLGLTTYDKGYMVYDTDLSKPYYWSGTSWETAIAIVPGALTKTDDTNVTLTLGGTPGTALLEAVSLTLGWTGTLADSRIASASTWNGKQNALSGSGIVKSTSGTISYISGTSSQFVKGDGSLDSSTYLTTAVTSVGAGTGMNFTTITGTGNVDVDTAKVPYYATTPSNGLLKYTSGTWGIDTNNYLTTAVTSVSLSAPSAFTVSGSPVTGIGTLSFAGAGVPSQYIRGDGTLASFPTSGGGGSSISYYFNGSVAQGTIGGVAFKQMSKTPIIGAGTDFTINADGYIQSFITDAADPSLLNIPAGNWNFEMYFSASSGGGSPRFYVELYKWDGTTLSLISSSSANPEGITNGIAIDLYTTALAVPATTLLATDRLAIRVYVIHSGRTITLHTEDNHLCEIITTFSTGLTALNGLTAQVQYFQTGTANTNFNIDSLTTPGTHIFNLPVASDTNTGKLSNTDYTTFNNKASKGFAVAMAAAL